MSIGLRLDFRINFKSRTEVKELIFKLKQINPLASVSNERRV